MQSSHLLYVADALGGGMGDRFIAISRDMMLAMLIGWQTRRDRRHLWGTSHTRAVKAARHLNATHVRHIQVCRELLEHRWVDIGDTSWEW